MRLTEIIFIFPYDCRKYNAFDDLRKFKRVFHVGADSDQRTNSSKMKFRPRTHRFVIQSNSRKTTTDMFNAFLLHLLLLIRHLVDRILVQYNTCNLFRGQTEFG